MMNVKWKPKNLDCWSHSDEWANEFSGLLGRALTDEEFDEYFNWTSVAQSGKATLSENDCGEVKLVIKLDTPPSFCDTAEYLEDCLEGCIALQDAVLALHLKDEGRSA